MRALGTLASLRLAVPLLVLIAAASVLGGFIPQGRNTRLASDAPLWLQRLNGWLQLNDVFHSWWYVLLLAMLAASLLAVTVRRIPSIVRQRGRGPMLWILLSHVGILLVLAAMIYGGLSGFRYYVRVVEGDVTIVPALTFAIKLDDFRVDYYPPETFRHLGGDVRLPERQETSLSVYNHGSQFQKATVSPGRPAVIRGVTLLPSDKETGWVFDVVIQDPNGRPQVIPVRPWAPPLIRLGLSESRLLVHRLEFEAGAARTEVALLNEDGSRRSLGFATTSSPVRIGEFSVSIGSVRPYTGLHVYRRPERPLLLVAFAVLALGLFGYVLHRAWHPHRPASAGQVLAEHGLRVRDA